LIYTFISLFSSFTPTTFIFTVSWAPHAFAFPFASGSGTCILIKFCSLKHIAAQPKTTSKPAHAAPMIKKPSSQSRSTEEEVEFLEDDDDNQMDFDMAALNLGEKKPKTAKPKKVSSIASTPASSQPSSPKASPLAKIPASKRVDVEAEYAKRSSEKAKLNMVVIGHVDAGKSTLMGHFLYALGQVSDKTIKKYEREAQKIGKSSFAYAWVLDETGEERSR
jgi:elongation factor 1 alpha-like protein